MTKKFDVVIIGTGEAASAVAGRCRSAGWQVAIIGSRPFGGTCALRGCDPKKVLVGAAEVVDWVRRMTGNGIRAEHLRIDWPELMRFKRSFTEAVPKEREEAFAKRVYRRSMAAPGLLGHPQFRSTMTSWKGATSSSQPDKNPWT